MTAKESINILPGFLRQDHAAGGREEAEIPDPQAEML